MKIIQNSKSCQGSDAYISSSDRTDCSALPGQEEFSAGLVIMARDGAMRRVFAVSPSVGMVVAVELCEP